MAALDKQVYNQYHPVGKYKYDYCIVMQLGKEIYRGSVALCKAFIKENSFKNCTVIFKK